jgi:hypothetical protein
MAVTGYWVYENWRAAGHVAKVHQAVCGHCNDGRGQHGGTHPSNGRWHGPYESGITAMLAARGLGAFAMYCKNCLRN